MPDLLDRLKTALTDRYTIERELGAGGMATVYLAHDTKLCRPVALKVLKPELAAAIGPERFLREIAIAAKLNHPHILPVYDSGRIGGSTDRRIEPAAAPSLDPSIPRSVDFLYYTMPFVEGESLRDRLSREKQLPLDDSLQITREVADALSYAHSLGLVHRDIKPENILFQAGHALVADFGIAKAVSAASGERLTETGLAIGTPAYMSPEQAAGSSDIDGRSDLYSLGCVLYEMLSGETPYTGPTPQAILAKKLSEPLPRISVVREAVPPGLEAALAKALTRTPADRFATAGQFVEALARPETAVPPSAGTAMRRIPRRAKWAAAVVGLAVVALAALQVLRPQPLTITVSDITPVTSDPGVEFQPAISPGGQEVAYVAGRIDRPHLFVRSTANVAGGAAVALGDSTSGGEWLPEWTADGQSVRFADCGREGFDLSLLEARCVRREIGKLGGTVRAVPMPQGSRWAWSPSGSRVAFVRRDTIFTSWATDTVADRVMVLEPGFADIHSLRWSADEKRLAFVSGNSAWRVSANSDLSAIFVVDADGGEPQWVAGYQALNVSPAWLDERHLLFVSNRDGPRAVYVVEVGAHGARGEPRLVPGIGDPHSISYSVASRRLTFTKFTSRQNIWTYPLGQPAPVSIGEGVRVTTGMQLIESHDVSPDGNWLAYDGGGRGNMDLYKIPAAGGEPIPLARFPDGEAFAPRWSPDGREIAFYGGDIDGISVLPADGGTPTVLTEASGFNWDPAWSPDGLAIAFYSSRMGHSQTWFVQRDSVGGAWHEARLLVDSSRGIADWAPDGSGGISPGSAHLRHSKWAFVSREGRVLWRRDLAATYGLTLSSGAARYSRDGRTIYAVGEHRGGQRGVWAIPVVGRTPRLVVAFDDPALVGSGVSVGPDRLYLTVAEYESDIWVAKLNY